VQCSIMFVQKLIILASSYVRILR